MGETSHKSGKAQFPALHLPRRVLAQMERAIRGAKRILRAITDLWPTSCTDQCPDREAVVISVLFSCTIRNNEDRVEHTDIVPSLFNFWCQDQDVFVIVQRLPATLTCRLPHYRIVCTCEFFTIFCPGLLFGAAVCSLFWAHRQRSFIYVLL